MNASRDVRHSPARRRAWPWAALALAVSLGLHLWVLGGISGRWADPFAGVVSQRPTPPEPPRGPVQVVIASAERAPAPAAEPPPARPPIAAKQAPRAAPVAPRRPPRPEPATTAAAEANAASVRAPERAADTASTTPADPIADGTAGVLAAADDFGGALAESAPSAAEPPGRSGAVGSEVAPESGTEPGAAGATGVSGAAGATATATATATGTATANALPAGPLYGAPMPALPASQRQVFKVYYGDYSEQRSVARLEYRLAHDGQRYEIRTTGEAEGLISLIYSGVLTQVSVGRLGPDGLEPTRYAEQRGKRAERAVEFDYDRRQLRATGSDGALLLMPGTQDRLSVFYQLGLLARTIPDAFVAGRVHVLPVASMKSVSAEHFEVVGDETLIESVRAIRALHLRRQAPPGSADPGIDVWLGYDLQMLPVRVRIVDSRGRVLDQLIERDS